MIPAAYSTKLFQEMKPQNILHQLLSHPMLHDWEMEDLVQLDVVVPQWGLLLTGTALKLFLEQDEASQFFKMPTRRKSVHAVRI
jgi:hypothetical protein